MDNSYIPLLSLPKGMTCDQTWFAKHDMISLTFRVNGDLIGMVNTATHIPNEHEVGRIQRKIGEMTEKFQLETP